VPKLESPRSRVTGNVRLDVDQLSCRRRDGHRFCSEGVGVIGGGGAQRHGEKEEDELEEKERKRIRI
jgi:hypothetical protein